MASFDSSLVLQQVSHDGVRLDRLRMAHGVKAAKEVNGVGWLFFLKNPTPNGVRDNHNKMPLNALV